MRGSAPTLALVLALAACSPAADTPAADAPAANIAVPAPAATGAAAAAPATVATDRPVPAPSAAAGTKTIGLEGLGTLRIGQPAPTGWAERGAQTSAACRTVTSPDYPGVYAIVTEGKVRRITVGKRSDVTLVEGIGVGASEKDVAKWFAGFRSEPHKYEESPAKYLTAPNAAGGDPALRFEIAQDGRVSMIHVGTAPVLFYVEGCS